MRFKLPLLLPFGLAALLGLPAAGQKPDYRRQIQIPPQEIFTGMLRFSQEKNFAALEKSSQLLNPLYLEVQQSFQVDLAKEIKTGLHAQNPGHLEATVLRIIYYDMKALFRLAAREPDHSRAVIHLKTAFLDYSLLSARVQKADFTADQMIRKLFQKAGVLAGASSPFTEQHDADPRPELRAVTDEIETLLLNALSNLKAAPAAKPAA